MPILFNHGTGDLVQIAVWQIEEGESYFLDAIGLGPDAIEHLKGKRRLEWLTSRLLLKEILSKDQLKSVAKNEYGKPYLEGFPDVHISLSHTHGYAAVVLSSLPIGIDIQRPVAKIRRIAHKYLSPAELSHHDPFTLEQLHIYWGAKEVMYKIYGRRKVDFRSQLEVTGLNLETQALEGQIKMPDHQAEVQCQYVASEDFILVYGCAGVLPASIFHTTF